MLEHVGCIGAYQGSGSAEDMKGGKGVGNIYV